MVEPLPDLPGMVYDASTNRYYKRPPPGEHLPKTNATTTSPPRKHRRITPAGTYNRLSHLNAPIDPNESIWNTLRTSEITPGRWTDVDRLALRLRLSRHEIALPHINPLDGGDAYSSQQRRRFRGVRVPIVEQLPNSLWPSRRGRCYAPYEPSCHVTEPDVAPGADDGSSVQGTIGFLTHNILKVLFAPPDGANITSENDRFDTNGAYNSEAVRENINQGEGNIDTDNLSNDAQRVHRHEEMMNGTWVSVFDIRFNSKRRTVFALQATGPNGAEFIRVAQGRATRRNVTRRKILKGTVVAVEVVTLHREGVHTLNMRMPPGMPSWNGRGGTGFNSDVTSVRWLSDMGSDTSVSQGLLAGGSRSGDVLIWDLRASKMPVTKGCPGEMNAGSRRLSSICDIQASTNGLWVSRLGNVIHNLAKWDLRDGLKRPCVVLDGHRNKHKWLPLDVYGRAVAAGDDEGNVRIWDGEVGGRARGVLKFGSIATRVRFGGVVDGGGIGGEYNGGLRVTLTDKIVLCGVGCRGSDDKEEE